jgi:hypothetical protein
VIMRHIVVEYMPQGTLPKQNHPRQSLLFHQSHKALGKGIQLRRARRQRYTRDACIVNDLRERGTELRVAGMDQVLSGLQAPSFLHRDVACDLPHPRVIGIGRDTGNVDLASLQVDEE